MAAGPTLPPQAYTREILTSAFNWLQSQPESVRKLATTPDALVGLYTRAKRFGNSSFEADAPVSGQNFMSDLKNLAEGLKQFEEPKTSAGQTTTQTVLNQVNQVNHVNQVFTPVNLSGSPAGSPVASSPIPPSGLNDRSRSMIQEVKEQLNLSSDTEVLNMMVALAYKNLKNLLS